MTVQTAFTAHVEGPTAHTRTRLQAAVTADPGFQRSTDWLPRAADLLAQDRHDEVIRLLMDRMPGLLLSPVAHGMLARAHAGIHQLDDARREAYYRDVALQAILDSGSGTRAQPWQVLQVADEYTVLDHLGLVPQGQRVEHGDATVDVITCSDGSERCFELV